MEGRATDAGTAHPVLTRALARWWAGNPTPSPAARALAEVIADGEVTVAYQPIVRLETARPVGAEALVRIDPNRHRAFGSATAVIAVAEASGLIVPLGLAVLTHACAQLATWRRTVGGANWQVHVNVSPSQVVEPGAADDLERIIRDHGLPPGTVVLEVTESVALEVAGPATLALQTLESRGVELAIDDFGTGYATLDLLATIPARTLKLDRSFVAAVGAGGTVRGRALVVEAAIGLGRSIGLRVVATGVENETQAATLRAWGCHLAQGHLYGSAAPGAQLIPAPVDPELPLRRGGHGPARLPTGVLELAAATATLALASETEDGAAHARVTLTHALATSLTMERDRTDTNLLLSAIGDDGTSCALPHRGGGAAATLAATLAATPDLSPDAPIGSLAALSAELVRARRRDEQPDPTLTALTARPAGVPADVTAAVVAWWTQQPPGSDAGDLLRDADRRLRARDEGQHRVRSVLGMARAIGSSTDLIEVLAAAAEEARRVVAAATISISRFEVDRRELRTLVNVGDLAPWERPRPVDERYALADYPQAVARIESRSVHVGSIDDLDGDPDEQELMRRMGKGSWGAAPILVDDRVWGELFAATHADEPAFTGADAPFLLAVAGLIGVAVARTQDLIHLDQLVHEDALTRLPNRRRLEQHAEALLRDARRNEGPTLAMIDVNGLKLHNDEFGHAAGDELLGAVAEVLATAVAGIPAALAARIGGDEFCLITPGGEAAMRTILDAVHAGLGAVPPPQPRLSIGVVVAGPTEHDLASLLAQADSAQYDAKRAGAHLIVHGERAVRRPPGLRPSVRLRGPIDPATALQRWVDSVALDPSLARRLEGIADAAMSLLDLNRWVISSVETDGTLIIRHAHVRRATTDVPLAAPFAEQVHHLDDFPLTAQAFAQGRSFVVEVNDPTADEHERALLIEDGHRYLVGVPVTEAGGGQLLELYGDDASVPSSLAVQLVEALLMHRPGVILRHTDESQPAGPIGSGA